MTSEKTLWRHQYFEAEIHVGTSGVPFSAKCSCSKASTYNRTCPIHEEFIVQSCNVSNLPVFVDGLAQGCMIILLGAKCFQQSTYRCEEVIDVAELIQMSCLAQLNVWLNLQPPVLKAITPRSCCKPNVIQFLCRDAFNNPIRY